MKVVFGTNAGKSEYPVIWDATKVVNGHMQLVGMSGAGKTYTIKKIIHSLQKCARTMGQPLKIHNFDVHDDIRISGESAVLFSEQTDYGMNPLIVNPDPDYGGVRKTIANFIRTVNTTSHKIGHRQEGVLRKLLLEIYNSNGFYEDKPQSWVLNDGVNRRYEKRYPTLDDLHRYCSYRLRKLYTGTDNKAASALDKLNKEIKKLQNGIAKTADMTQDEGNAVLAKFKADCIGSYSDYVNSIESGKELDELIKYQSKETLHSIMDMIDRLRATGIFKSQYPPFDRSASTWSYRIKPLGEDVRKMFVLFRLRQLFREAMAGGEKDHIDTVIVLDEAHIYLDDDPENIVNTIAKEARKFGMMLIAASQSPKAYPDDFLSSVATKVVLGIDELHWDSAVKKMKMTQKELQAIQLQKQIMVQIKNKGQARAQFQWTKVA